MASLQIQKQPKEGFGQKVKNVVETVGTIKGLYDTGRTIYSGMQFVAPYAAAGLALL